MDIKLKKEVLQKLVPDTTERSNLKKITSDFLTKLSLPKGVKAIVGGSGAKDTWLSGNHDVDVFVLFPYQEYNYRSLELSDILDDYVKKSFPKRKRVHGSRDYFQLSFSGLDFEIVPIIFIKKAEDALNITDISPLHIKWVNDHTMNLKDDVRLAKQFFRAQGLYGAESYISGFSGYVVEILVAYYGSFLKLLKSATKWREGEVIDPEKHYPKKDALFHINKSKTLSPLVVVDPVDKSRNALAALSKEIFNLTKKKAAALLKKPNTGFFEKKLVNYDLLKKEAEKKNWKLVILDVKELPGKKDVVGMKLLKSFNFLKRNLEPFVIKKSGWQWEKEVLFYFMLEKAELPAIEIREGPPLALKDFVKDFKKKNKDSFVQNGRVKARVKVKYPQLKKAVNHFIKEKYVMEKIKGVKVIY
jgi:tRNA nucleotidyltransferase (CCA-adding enzyme)